MSAPQQSELAKREDERKRQRAMHYELMDAIQLDRAPEALAALDRGADPLELYERKWNAICMAGIWGAHNCVAALTGAGVAVETPGPAGNQAIHFSAAGSCALTVEALLRAGASASALNERGSTPLQRAIDPESVEVARALLDAGADPNAFAPADEPTLSLAAMNGSAELVELLLSRGADPDLKGGNGRSPRDVAEFNYPGCLYLKARLERDELALSAGPTNSLGKKRAI